MKEIWKDIKGYEGLYQVSNLGRVRSLDRFIKHSSSKTGLTLRKGKIMSLKKDKEGYCNINFCKDGIKKYYRVHRLVAETFIPNPNNYPIVNHKDEIKDNNSIDNLEWCDHQYNNTYGTRIEKSIKNNIGKHSKRVRCITTGKEFDSLKEAGDYYGCNLTSNMNKVTKPGRHCGKLPDGTPLKWEYID